jgi:glycosyltransferase involved in cell wall biosynthesis
MSERHVVVAFADKSLGGVSRSALSAGQMWVQLGYTVTFLAFLPIHAGRIARFEAVGTIVSKAADIHWRSISLVHLHHAAASPQTLGAIADLQAGITVPVFPPLMTKNVFAVDDHFLDGWKAPRAATVPGRWTTLQYAFNRGRTLRSARTWIIPNVQDTNFFRLPTSSERAEARARFGFDERIDYVLRIGSPIDTKWSRTYITLAKELAANQRLVLVGVPKSLVPELSSFENVVIRATTSSDTELRDLYWASDMFALYAARGETFGNVAFESLLCGLPVTYRARPYRDNTPWELRHIEGFSYANGDRQWVRFGLTSRSRVGARQRELIADQYGPEAVLKAYSAVVQGLANKPDGQVWPPEEQWQREIKLRDSIRVLAWHNPVVSLAKRLRLARR